MRLTEDARRSVVFLGHLADPPNEDSFVARATGFFIEYAGLHYLVTAAHVAVELGADPFDMRLNRISGGALVLHFDSEMDPMDRWFIHPEDGVDVAVMAFPFDFAANDWDHLSISNVLLMTEEEVAAHDLGPGDFCYAVGLFRLMQGQKRNLPVVHRGSIAAMPSDELIPMKGWRGAGKIQARAYLVESTNLQGLSGSPVLARPTISVVANHLHITRSSTNVSVRRGPEVALSAPSNDVMLLGVWSGSWDASPDEALSLDQGREVRVPLGLGVVVPTHRLLELLTSDDVAVQRKSILDRTPETR